MEAPGLNLATGCIVALSFTAPILWAQTSPRTESGKFRLHLYEQEVGEESYTITNQSQALTLRSDFQFTDFHTPVPLTATLHTSQTGLPLSFTINGRTSVTSEIDAEVTVSGSAALIREGKDSRTVAVPRAFFTISGYAPVAVQMMMMRYWRAHGSPAEMPTLPAGTVRIRDRGRETFRVNGRNVQVERYLIDGLIWGMQTLWMDGSNNLAALVTMDAGYTQFEAVRQEFEPALPAFVASAARDRIAVLEERSRKLPGRRVGTFAFVGATLIDGTARPPVRNATVVTANGKIVAAGPSASVRIPAGAERIDIAGKYIIPGLWDMHAHYEQVEWGPLYLAAGVTTVRDLGSELDFITQVRDAANRGHGIGPRLLLAGMVDGDPATRAVGIARVNSPEDARKWVQRYHAAGFQQIKIYSSIQPENVKAICTEAHRLGMTVTGHIPNGMDAYAGVQNGMDMINHARYLQELLLPQDSDRSTMGEARLRAYASIDATSEAGKRAVEFFRQHGTVIDPTLSLMELQILPTTDLATRGDPGLARVPPVLRPFVESVSYRLPPPLVPLAEQVFERTLGIVNALHRAGVPIVAGTDIAVPGFSIYREIELYAKAGFTPLEALQSATIVSAKAMKADAESGTVEVGKRADLDILDANPLEDIHNIRTVRMVLANGVLYESKPLWSSVGFRPQ